MRSRARHGSWVVAGCDPRIEEAAVPDGVRVLGLNDHTAVPHCHEQLVVDPPSCFHPRRVPAILDSDPEVFWYWEKEPWPLKEHPDKRPIEIVHATRWRGKLREGPVPCYYTTMVTGIVLAFRAGAQRIGVLGCNLVGHEELNARVGEINEFVSGFLTKALRKEEVEMRNVSPPGVSARLQIPRAPIDWLAESST